jgi:hypothetical protein
MQPASELAATEKPVAEGTDAGPRVPLQMMVSRGFDGERAMSEPGQSHRVVGRATAAPLKAAGVDWRTRTRATDASGGEAGADQGVRFRPAREPEAPMVHRAIG